VIAIPRRHPTHADTSVQSRVSIGFYFFRFAVEVRLPTGRHSHCRTACRDHTRDRQTICALSPSDARPRDRRRGRGHLARLPALIGRSPSVRQARHLDYPHLTRAESASSLSSHTAALDTRDSGRRSGSIGSKHISSPKRAEVRYRDLGPGKVLLMELVHACSPDLH
jgi:hypothetical protein